jgi:hypothetical protein
MKSVVLNMPPLATAACLPDLKMPSDMEIVPHRAAGFPFRRRYSL